VYKCLDGSERTSRQANMSREAVDEEDAYNAPSSSSASVMDQHLQVARIAQSSSFINKKRVGSARVINSSAATKNSKTAAAAAAKLNEAQPQSNPQRSGKSTVPSKASGNKTPSQEQSEVNNASARQQSLEHSGFVPVFTNEDDDAPKEVATDETPVADVQQNVSINPQYDESIFKTTFDSLSFAASVEAFPRPSKRPQSGFKLRFNVNNSVAAFSLCKALHACISESGPAYKCEFCLAVATTEMDSSEELPD